MTFGGKPVEAFGSTSKQHMTSRKLHVNICKEREKKGFCQVESLTVSIFRIFLWQKKMMDIVVV